MVSNHVCPWRKQVNNVRPEPIRRRSLKESSPCSQVRTICLNASLCFNMSSIRSAFAIATERPLRRTVKSMNRPENL